MYEDSDQSLGLDEYHQHVELIARAAKKVDELGNDSTALHQISECMDWLAFLTREHFGMQLRLIRGCTQHGNYLLERSTLFSEYRRKLAELYIDAMRQDSSVPTRLKSLCHALLEDMQAEYARFMEVVRGNLEGLRQRKKQRQDPVVQTPSWVTPPDSPAMYP
jgi:hypothetical protein